MRNDVTTALINALKEIHDDNDFIVGILTFAESEDDRKKVLDFIKAGDDVDVETVSVLSIELDRQRKTR